MLVCCSARCGFTFSHSSRHSKKVAHAFSSLTPEREQVQELKTADKTQMKQMARVQRHEAALILQEKDRDSRLRARLSRLQTADSLKVLSTRR